MGHNDSSNIIKIGYVGNQYLGSHWDEEGKTKIVQIFVSHGNNVINSIQFQYAENGTLVLSDKHGRTTGSKFDVVRLNYPVEYITWISGSKDNENRKICSITFGTNQGEYGPFGLTKCGRDDTLRLGGDRQFGGFYGTADHYSVISIGVYLKPITNLDYSFNRNAIEHPEEAKMCDDSSNFIKIDPQGSQSGDCWDEKGHASIVRIFVSHGNDLINSIQFQYAENGSIVLSDKHGTSSGSNFDIVKLNYPAEYITRISGHRRHGREEFISSITFGTNHGEYGPFGCQVVKQTDVEFSLQAGDHLFFGFHGTVGYCYFHDTVGSCYGVKSIGVYLKPNMTLDNKKIVKVRKL